MNYVKEVAYTLTEKMIHFFVYLNLLNVFSNRMVIHTPTPEELAKEAEKKKRKEDKLAEKELNRILRENENLERIEKQLREKESRRLRRVDAIMKQYCYKRTIDRSFRDHNPCLTGWDLQLYAEEEERKQSAWKAEKHREENQARDEQRKREQEKKAEDKESARKFRIKLLESQGRIVIY